MILTRRFRVAFLLAATLSVLGCGGSGPKFVEVQGTLTVNGKPLEKIQVEFWPEGEGPRSIGLTDAQGNFTLTSDDGTQKGAVVGSHKVVLKDGDIFGGKFLGRKAENLDPSKAKKSRINQTLSNATSTPIKKTVTDGQKNTIDIQVP
jgi:hypothetical protein